MLRRSSSAGKARNGTEFTRADPSVIAKKPREMGGYVEPEPGSDLGHVDVVVHDCFDRTLQAHDVEIDPGRYADRGFKQAKEMSSRQSGLPRKDSDVHVAGDVGPNLLRHAADAGLRSRQGP